MSRINRHVVLSLLLGLNATWLLLPRSDVGAQNTRPATRPVRKTTAPQKTYSPGDVHLDKSRVYIHVGKTGLGHEHGVIGKLKEGVIHLSGGEEGDQLVFDMTSFDADSDAARKYVGLEGSTDDSTRQQVNQNMLGEGVLNVRKHPTATFAIKSIKPMKAGGERNLPQYQIKGEFTLHGKTQPVTILADAEEKQNWTHLRGSFSILQSDYGITPFSKAFGAVGVTDRLKIWGDLWVAGTTSSSSQ